MSDAPSARSLIGKAPSGAARAVMTDEVGRLINISLPQSLLSQNKLFYIYDRSTLAILKRFLIKVGSNPVDMWFNIAAGLTTPVELLEGCASSSDGSSVPVRNFDRTTSATIGVTAFTGGTYTGGSSIFDGQAGFGSALSPVSGDIMSILPDRTIPWRLKANTNYVINETPLASILVEFVAVFAEVS